MNLTGKAKRRFEKWWVNEYDNRGHKDIDNVQMGLMSSIIINHFNSLTDSMKFGVYVDFFKSEKIYESSEWWRENTEDDFLTVQKCVIYESSWNYLDYYTDLNKANIEWIFGANELLNEILE